MKQLLRSKSYRGFTLVELLVVIAIIGLLAAVTFVAVNPARVKARDARRIADIKSLQTAIELCKDDNSGNAPASLAVPGTGLCGTKNFGDYIGKIPTDPSTNTAYGNTTANYGTATGGKYCIRFTTENSNTSLGSGTAWVATSIGIVTDPGGGNCTAQ